MDVNMLTVDPIGEVKPNPELDVFVDELKQKFDGEKKSPIKLIKFMLHAIDELVRFVEKIIQKGPDKKAAVIAASAGLYTYTTKKGLCFWMKPFAGGIKGFVINTVISIIVDWIVSKYNAGSWKEKEQE